MLTPRKPTRLVSVAAAALFQELKPAKYHIKKFKKRAAAVAKTTKTSMVFTRKSLVLISQ